MDRLAQLISDSDDSEETCKKIEEYIIQNNLRPVPSNILLHLSTNNLSTLEMLMRNGVDINELLIEEESSYGSFVWDTLMAVPSYDSLMFDFLIANGGKLTGTFVIGEKEMDIFEYVEFWMDLVCKDTLKNYQNEIFYSKLKKVIDQLAPIILKDKSLRKKYITILMDLKLIEVIEYFIEKCY